MPYQRIVSRSLARRSAPAHFRFHPLHSRGVDALFDGLLRGASPVAPARATLGPRVDVQDMEEALRLSAELPGLEASEFTVVVNGDVLTIESVKAAEEEENAESSAADARSVRAFSRSFRIPFEFDADSVSGSYRNGLLSVMIPKPSESASRIRTIPVTVD